MTILNIDDLVAGLANGPAPNFLYKVIPAIEAAGVLVSPFYMSGIPGAATVPSPGVNGAALTAYAGQIPFPALSSQDCYVGVLSCGATLVGKMFLADRLWHNSGLSVTTLTEQTLTSPTLPARDADGATAGNAVLAGIEVSTATTNGAAITTITLNYTNSSGTSGRTATISNFPATAVAGTFVPFQLQAGDVGIRSIQGITLGTSLAAGAIHLVAYRVICEGPVNVANGGSFRDTFRLGMPRCYANTVPFVLFQPSGASAANIHATVKFAVN